MRHMHAAPQASPVKKITGTGFPSAWQCSSVPDEFENLIFVEGRETNFGPSKSEPLKPLQDAPPRKKD